MRVFYSVCCCIRFGADTARVFYSVCRYIRFGADIARVFFSVCCCIRFGADTVRVFYSGFLLSIILETVCEYKEKRPQKKKK